MDYTIIMEMEANGDGVMGEGGGGGNGTGFGGKKKNMLSTFHTGPIFQNIYGSASNISTGVHKHTHTRCARVDTKRNETTERQFIMHGLS